MESAISESEYYSDDPYLVDYSVHTCAKFYVRNSFAKSFLETEGVLVKSWTFHCELRNDWI